MSAHAILNLSMNWEKRDKMQGLSGIYLFQQ